MMLFRSLFVVANLAIVGSSVVVPTVHARQLDGGEVCFEGYVLDTYCIEQGFFEDDAEAVPLKNPETHSFICMLNPPYCRASGYEVLGDPETEGGNYTRVAKLDQAGNTMIINLGLEVGSGCAGCVGDTDKGLRAVVVGKMVDGDNSTPPLMNVTKVGAAGATTCDELMLPEDSAGSTHSRNVWFAAVGWAVIMTFSLH